MLALVTVLQYAFRHYALKCDQQKLSEKGIHFLNFYLVSFLRLNKLFFTGIFAVQGSNRGRPLVPPVPFKSWKQKRMLRESGNFFVWTRLSKDLFFYPKILIFRECWRLANNNGLTNDPGPGSTNLRSRSAFLAQDPLWAVRTNQCTPLTLTSILL